MSRPKRIMLQPNKRFSGSRFSLSEFKPARPVPPIEIVTRQRVDFAYLGTGQKPPLITISLPRVKGFFEALYAKHSNGGPAKEQPR